MNMIAYPRSLGASEWASERVNERVSERMSTTDRASDRSTAEQANVCAVRADKRANERWPSNLRVDFTVLLSKVHACVFCQTGSNLCFIGDGLANSSWYTYRTDTLVPSIAFSPILIFDNLFIWHRHRFNIDVWDFCSMVNARKTHLPIHYEGHMCNIWCLFASLI